MAGFLNRVKGLAQNVAGTALGEAKAALTGGQLAGLGEIHSFTLTHLLHALQPAATPDDESEVELQLQRISDALMPDYRRDAMRQLAELLTENPKVCE
jgi:hypothetical protein